MVNKAAQELGSLGGKSRARNLSHEDMVQIGKKGAAKRWGGKKKTKKK